MAQNKSYNWPVINKQAVCKTQDVNAGDNLVLNGTMSVSGASQISFIRTGVSRSVSIHSTDNLSAAKFTVTGIQNGAGIIKNNITGPAANATVYIDEVFDVITSVTVDSNVTNVQVGTGKTGFLPLLSTDSALSLISIRSTNGLQALSIIPMNNSIPAIGEITYTVWTTLENIDDNGIPFLSQLDRLFHLSSGDPDLVDASEKKIYQATKLTNYLLLQVTDSANPETNSLDLIFMQS